MCSRREMETSCKTYFMFGEIKELKKKVFIYWIQKCLLIN